MTKYYDRAGKRVPSPRGERVPSTMGSALLALVLIVSVIGLCIAAYLHQTPKVVASAKVERVVTHDSLGVTYTYNGEIIRWYVFTDPDTGEQTLVNDRGGCTPRLDSTGEPMGVSVDYTYE